MIPYRDPESGKGKGLSKSREGSLMSGGLEASSRSDESGRREKPIKGSKKSGRHPLPSIETITGRVPVVRSNEGLSSNKERAVPRLLAPNEDNDPGLKSSASLHQIPSNFPLIHSSSPSMVEVTPEYKNKSAPTLASLVVNPPAE